MQRPRLSVIVITLDEEANIEPALDSLLAQEGVPLEVLVVDGASLDRTVELAQKISQNDRRVRVFASPSHLSVGQARNKGLLHAQADAIAFMSADATAQPGWARSALEGLERSDIVYGRQEHEPGHTSVAAMVRGMRYHHFRRNHDQGQSEHEDAAAFASNVNAAIRREVFKQLRYVDEGPASALDDILFTTEARDLGYEIAYRSEMVVAHKDACTLREEAVKNRREGYGWGLLAPRLGIHRMVAAWGLLLVAALTVLAVWPGLVTLVAIMFAVWLPTLRRAVRSLGLARSGTGKWFAAIAVGPYFDLVFLFNYLNGLRRRRRDLSGLIHPQGA